MPELDYLLDDHKPCEHYPYTRSYDEAKYHPCLIIHTSGPTGLPKPVIWPQNALTASLSHHTVPPLDGRRATWGSFLDTSDRSFNGFPVFHGLGIISSLRKILFNRTIVVLGPPGIPTADTLDQVLGQNNIDDIACLPVTLEEIASRPDVLAKLGKLKFVTYAGGDGHTNKALGPS
jgi:acyl-CoA synthetase (AMP-forming)/AMP-acid ligase II